MQPESIESLVMPTKNESVLASLNDAIDKGEHAGLVSMHLGSLASLQWDAYGRSREDWASIYNMWLLLADLYRLEFFWEGAPASTNVQSRKGSLSSVLKYACFGIWCGLWEKPALAERSRGWCESELAALKGSLGPSASLVECFMANHLTPSAAAEWSGIRKKFSRGGMNRPEVHNDYFPYDILAPELAWCAKEGQVVPRSTAIVVFPRIQEWPLTSATESALIAIASSRWA